MGFTPKTWFDGSGGGTPITAAELNRIETGILDGMAPPPNALTVSMTLTIAHLAMTLVSTATSDITVTIPAHASVAFPVGTQIPVVTTTAANVTFSPASGVTLNSLNGSRTLAGQYVQAILIKTGTNTWVATGALESIGVITVSAFPVATIHKWCATTGLDTNPGTETQPYLTPQKLADNLTAGQVGAIKAGTYLGAGASANGELLTMRVAGTGTSAYTRIIGAPGEARPVLRGRVYLNASYTSLEGIYCDLSGITGASYVGIGIGRGSISVTGTRFYNCIIDGGNSDTQGILCGGSSLPADNLQILGNVFRNIVGYLGGNPAGHGVYWQRGNGGLISGNIFYLVGTSATVGGDRAIQLYPRTTNVVVEHNTIDQCSGGIVYGNDTGDGAAAGGHSVNNNLWTNLVQSASGQGRAAFTSVGVVTPRVTADTNVFFNNINGDGTSNGDTTFTGSILATDPLYVDRTNRNYKLGTTSTVKTKGAYASATPPLD